MIARPSWCATTRSGSRRASSCARAARHAARGPGVLLLLQRRPGQHPQPAPTSAAAGSTTSAATRSSPGASSSTPSPSASVALVDRDPAFGTDRLTSALLDFGGGRQLDLHRVDAERAATSGCSSSARGPPRDRDSRSTRRRAAPCDPGRRRRRTGRQRRRDDHAAAGARSARSRWRRHSGQGARCPRGRGNLRRLGVVEERELEACRANDRPGIATRLAEAAPGSRRAVRDAHRAAEGSALGARCRVALPWSREVAFAQCPELSIARALFTTPQCVCARNMCRFPATVGGANAPGRWSRRSPASANRGARREDVRDGAPGATSTKDRI